MSLLEWDQEIETLREEIAAATSAHRRTRFAHNRNLIEKKITIIQKNINIDLYMEKIMSLVKRDNPLLPREKALLHFAGEFVDKIKEYMANSNKLSIRKMWVNLIQARVSGASGPGRSDQIVALAVRHRDLHRTEKLLSQSLVELDGYKKHLDTKYKQLAIARSNYVASKTMTSNLGSNEKAALNAPEIKALSHYLKSITAPVHSLLDEEKIYAKHKEYTQKTNALLEDCKAAALEEFIAPDAPLVGLKKDQIERDLKELYSLEVESRSALLSTQPKIV